MENKKQKERQKSINNFFIVNGIISIIIIFCMNFITLITMLHPKLTYEEIKDKRLSRETVKAFINLYPENTYAYNNYLDLLPVESIADVDIDNSYDITYNGDIKTYVIRGLEQEPNYSVEIKERK